MSLEEKKAALHEAIESETSEPVLDAALNLLTEKLPMLTPEEEEAVAEGLAEIEAGNYLTLEEFRAQNQALREARRQRAEGK